jgi:DNA-binding transcriptional LysR family regulator
MRPSVQRKSTNVVSDLAQGTLVPVFPDFPPSPTPRSISPNRQLSPRFRLFIDWVVRAFGSD